MKRMVLFAIMAVIAIGCDLDNVSHNVETPDAQSQKQKDAVAQPREKPVTPKSEDSGMISITWPFPDATVSSMPRWSRQAGASGIFTAPTGQKFHVLIYERIPGESLEAWMARSEVGDAYISAHHVRSGNYLTGYVYKSGDHGLPSVHITFASARFVYYFYIDEVTPEVPPDFLEFVKRVALH